mmetsp:Transcript_43890/g.81977  ORF Transcript_43890/g.81977 Transcript_43890/m.81977 type:complete len:606 (-) Transcript_43890:31-1848(-)
MKHVPGMRFALAFSLAVGVWSDQTKRLSTHRVSSQASSHAASKAASDLQQILQDGKMSIPLSLQAIQTTLVKMGHEVSNNTAVTTADFAKSIEPLLFSMQDTIRSQNKLTQQTLDNSWGTFTACSFDFGGPSGFEDLASLENSHKTCRVEEGMQKTGLDACRIVQGNKESALADAKKDFHGDEASGTKGKNVLPEPNSCDFEQVGASWTSPKEYLEYFENHFGNLLSDWRASRDAVVKTQNETNVQTALCDGKETKWTGQKNDCAEFQKALENAACDILSHNTACRSYTGCYNREWHSHGETEKLTKTQEAEQKAEMMGTLKILCMIRVFGQTDLNAKINRCLEAEYAGSSEVTALQITYYPNTKTPMPTDQRGACASASKASMIPGTKSFENTHYSGLPTNAAFSSCSASCCGYAEPTCLNYGCSSKYVKTQLCQCNAECETHGDCCWDYFDKCNVHTKDYNILLNEVAFTGAAGTCEGADWIELYNAGHVTRDIKGWTLSVEKPDPQNPGSTVQYDIAFDTSQAIEPAASLVVCAKPGGLKDGSLPNIEVEFESGNKITWSDKDGNLISSTRITSSEKGSKTWSRLADGQYVLAEPTPGAKNK